MEADTINVPAWTLGWRLRRALAFADISFQEIADELGVDRRTVSRWANDRGTPPRRVYVKEWAARCGVPYEWLVDGDPEAQPATSARSTQVKPDYCRFTSRSLITKPQLAVRPWCSGQHRTAVAPMDAAGRVIQRVA